MNDHDNDDAIELNDGNPDVNNAPATPCRNVQPISGIRPPQALGVDVNISEKWKLFTQKWKNYSVITNLRAVNKCTNSLCGNLTHWEKVLKGRLGTH